MEMLTYNERTVFSPTYKRPFIRAVLRVAERTSVQFASKRFSVPTSIVTLWCRMAGIKYSLPPKKDNPRKRDLQKAKKDLERGFPEKDVCLWHGLYPHHVKELKKDMEAQDDC